MPFCWQRLKIHGRRCQGACRREDGRREREGQGLLSEDGLPDAGKTRGILIPGKVASQLSALGQDPAKQAFLAYEGTPSKEPREMAPRKPGIILCSVRIGEFLMSIVFLAILQDDGMTNGRDQLNTHALHSLLRTCDFAVASADRIRAIV